ncbi:MAG: winged helix-turn-helix domain-containing protein [Candidatus Bathyarchaeota archaeon]|nr:winged helix-turn-helix domain-containing protein [Candidatus Bathyarchaeota archaeon]
MKRRSRIQICLDVLSILSQRGLSRITHIMYESNTNCRVLKNNLTYMVQKGLVDKKPVGKERIAYQITQKGVTILNKFKEFKQMLPVVEETHNQFPIIV